MNICVKFCRSDSHFLMLDCRILSQEDVGWFETDVRSLAQEMCEYPQIYRR